MGLAVNIGKVCLFAFIQISFDLLYVFIVQTTNNC